MSDDTVFLKAVPIEAVPIEKIRHTIQITNDRPRHRPNYQWQASI